MTSTSTAPPPSVQQDTAQSAPQTTSQTTVAPQTPRPTTGSATSAAPNSAGSNASPANTNNTTTATPAAGATNTAGTNPTSATTTPTSTKRRPYEDPTDGERYQLYAHSRQHPELKQKDLVTWFAQNFGKEINQSTVSRALKRYRDNPPGDPEREGRARSKRGGGGGGTPGATGVKRRRTGGGGAQGTISATEGETGSVGSTGVEEEAARADEQVQRENQQGIIGRTGTKTESSPEGMAQPQVLPYARAGQPHHHHHTLPQHGHPPPPQQLAHSIQQIPIPGHPPGFQAANVPPHVPPPLPYPVYNHHAPHYANHAIQHGIDYESDSDTSIPDAPANNNGYPPSHHYPGHDSDEAELAYLTKRWETFLVKSCFSNATTANNNTSGSSNIPNPNITAGTGGNVAPVAPMTNGTGTSSTNNNAANASSATANANAGNNNASGNATSAAPEIDATTAGILSREALVTYLVGRNELLRSLQERVRDLDRENRRLKRKNAAKSQALRAKDEVIARLTRQAGGPGTGVEGQPQTPQQGQGQGQGPAGAGTGGS